MEDEKELVAPQMTEEVEVELKETAEAEPEFTESEKKLWARAKKAEEKERDLKKEIAALKAEKEDKIKKQQDPPPANEELRLIAKGFSDEEIEEAKAIAKGKDIPLSEAIKTKTFLLFQEDIKETQRKEKAKLGASKGSGQSAEETLIKPGMSKEDHKAAWQKLTG